MITTVRPAQPADWPAIVDLQSEARLSLTEQRGGPEWLLENPEQSTFSESRSEPGAERTSVALIDDVIVGSCHTMLGAPGGIALVDWLYVTPEARELGLGEELLNDAIDTARETGATRIESCALPGDRETKNMFERFGMKARLLIVGMPLSEQPLCQSPPHQLPPHQLPPPTEL